MKDAMVAKSRRPTASLYFSSDWNPESESDIWQISSNSQIRPRFPIKQSDMTTISDLFDLTAALAGASAWEPAMTGMV